jgi:hypothetical protein
VWGMFVWGGLLRRRLLIDKIIYFLRLEPRDRDGVDSYSPASRALLSSLFVLIN